MRTLGLIGGMSAESTTLYYQLLNRQVRERLGGLHSARLVMLSLDFAPIARMQSQDAWDEAGAVLARAGVTLQDAGAEALLICANTMHICAEAVQSAVSIPLIHIGDATAEALLTAGARRPLLLATRYTMEKPFYRGRLAERGLSALVPDAGDRAELQRIIYDELCVGLVTPRSKAQVLAMIEAARREGADSVIFGCTEIGLLLRPDEAGLPAFDTTEIHARAAVDFSLAAEPACP